MAESVLNDVRKLQSRLTGGLEPKKVLKSLKKLSELPITVDILAETGVGRTVNGLRKYQQVGDFARSLVARWKLLLPPESQRHSHQLTGRRHDPNVSKKRHRDHLPYRPDTPQPSCSYSYYEPDSVTKKVKRYSDTDKSHHGGSHDIPQDRSLRRDSSDQEPVASSELNKSSQIIYVDLCQDEEQEKEQNSFPQKEIKSYQSQDIQEIILPTSFGDIRGKASSSRSKQPKSSHKEKQRPEDKVQGKAHVSSSEGLPKDSSSHALSGSTKRLKALDKHDKKKHSSGVEKHKAYYDLDDSLNVQRKKLKTYDLEKAKPEKMRFTLEAAYGDQEKPKPEGDLPHKSKEKKRSSTFKTSEGKPRVLEASKRHASFSSPKEGEMDDEYEQPTMSFESYLSYDQPQKKKKKMTKPAPPPARAPVSAQAIASSPSPSPAQAPARAPATTSVPTPTPARAPARAPASATAPMPAVAPAPSPGPAPARATVAALAPIPARAPAPALVAAPIPARAPPPALVTAPIPARAPAPPPAVAPIPAPAPAPVLGQRTGEDKGQSKPIDFKSTVKTSDAYQKAYKQPSEKKPVEATASKAKKILSDVVPMLPHIPLPPAQAHYRTLPSVDMSTPPPPKKKALSSPTQEEESGFTGRRLNSKMLVYSGNKTAYLPKMMTLYEQCIRVLSNNIDSIYEVGGVPYTALEPVLERCTPNQLYRIEEYNHFLTEDTDGLWHIHCQRDFRNEKPEEFESWREMYLRLHDAREQRLLMLTENIRSAYANKPKARVAKMAFVNTTVKPPREVRKRQEKFGTGGPAVPEKMKFKAVCTMTKSSSVYSEEEKPYDGPSTSSGTSGSSQPTTSSAPSDPKKPTGKKVAPMMAKTIKAFKNRFARR